MRVKFNWRRLLCCPGSHRAGRNVRQIEVSTASSTKSSTPINITRSTPGPPSVEGSIITTPSVIITTARETLTNVFTENQLVQPQPIVPESMQADSPSKDFYQAPPDAPSSRNPSRVHFLRAKEETEPVVPVDSDGVQASNPPAVEERERAPEEVPLVKEGNTQSKDPQICQVGGQETSLHAGERGEIALRQEEDTPLNDVTADVASADGGIYTNLLSSNLPPASELAAEPIPAFQPMEIGREELVPLSDDGAGMEGIESGDGGEGSDGWSLGSEAEPEEIRSNANFTEFDERFPYAMNEDAIFMGSSSEDSFSSEDSEGSLFVDGDLGAIFFPQPVPDTMYLGYAERELVRDFGEDLCKAFDSVTGEVIGYSTYQPFANADAIGENERNFEIAFPSHPLLRLRGKRKFEPAAELLHYKEARHSEAMASLRDHLWVQQGKQLKTMSFKMTGNVANRRTRGGGTNSGPRPARSLDENFSNLVVGVILNVLEAVDQETDVKGKSRTQVTAEETDDGETYVFGNEEWESKYDDYFSIPLE
ncbi:hypothetical protein DFH27DRAFT_525434 [Peziza echinospora]|nr:hypothetical protein DFH27DRAFT_525434 [Peziza echinospora]